MLDLTEVEKAKLRRFWDDEPMREAVRKVLLHELSMGVNLRLAETDLSNLQIGEIVRGAHDGVVRVQQAFQEISQYQSLPEKRSHQNPAR